LIKKAAGFLRAMRQDRSLRNKQREDNMADTKKDSEKTDQNQSDETAMDRKVERIANEAAKKAIKTEQRFDEEHGIFTK
jgi:hypothetical protein